MGSQATTLYTIGVTVTNSLDPPDKARYGVDWSVKATASGLSRLRFVTYGLERPEIEAFLAARGVAFGGPMLVALQEKIGPLDRVMVGADGERTKLYGDLDGNDPAMVCLDLWRGGRSALRVYRRFGAEDADAAIAACTEPMARELRWLLSQPECETHNVFHIALQRFGLEGPFTGGDVGFASHWESLVHRDESLFRVDLMRRMLARHHVEHHLDDACAALCAHPLGTVDYVGFRQLDGAFAVNLYAKKNPVVTHSGVLCEVDKLGQTFRYRPLVISFRIEAQPEVLFRLQPSPTGQVYRRFDGWGLAYQEAPGHAAEQLERQGVLTLAVDAARRAVRSRSSTDLIPVLESLRSNTRIQFASIAPDTTGSHEVVGVDQHYTAG